MNIRDAINLNNELLKNYQHLTDIVNTPIKMPEIPAIRNYHLADYQYEIIKNAIIEFENSLDQEHEIALKLSSFGQTILLNVTDLGYSNPSLIHFYGYLDNGSRVELIQHVSQINFLLVAVPKPNPNDPPRRIGFSLENSEHEQSNNSNVE